MKARTLITIFSALMLLASCGTKKTVTEQTTTSQGQTTNNQHPTTNNQISYVCDMDMTIAFGKDSYDLGGKASMRQNEVVRLNLTFMGLVEVGVIEFTPDYVLVVNRMGKEYCKADYSLEVLRKNNITFDKVWEMADAQLRSSKKKKDNTLGTLVQNLINTNMKSDKKVTVTIEFGEPNTKKSFNSRTELSSKYKEVSPDELMSRLMSALK